MKYTTNYNLKQPEGTDIVNIDDLNENADIIDQKLKELEDGVADAQTEANEAEARAKAYTDQKVSTHAAVKASLSQLGHVNHTVLTTTLNTTWQGSKAPYTKTQTVNGLLATDTPIVDVVMSGNFETDEARIEAWGYVYRITTADNAITLYATEKPTVSLPIQLKVVR